MFSLTLSLGIGEGGVSCCVWRVGGITCPELRRVRIWVLAVEQASVSSLTRDG